MKKEIRVYVINVNETDADVMTLNDSDFMDIAEEQGNIMTTDTFTKLFNEERINSNTDVIRFIEVNGETTDKVIAWFESIDVPMLTEQLNTLRELEMNFDEDSMNGEACCGIGNMVSDLLIIIEDSKE